FSQADFQTLSETKYTPCISIYLPTHKSGSEIQQDPIRLKNLIAKAERKLIQEDWKVENVQKLLKPATDLLEHQTFWQHQKSGLSLFIAQGFFQLYSVPIDFDELVTVGDRFHTKPLIPLITEEQVFYVLAASQNKVELYHATQDDIQPVALEEAPTSLEEALRYDDPEASLQGHGTGKSGSRRVFHGQGGGKDSENTDILRFFHLVSDGVESVLSGQTAPLVFVGLDFLFPIYKQANSYSHLIEQAVDIQPDQLSPKDLHSRALDVLTPYFSARRQASAEQYGNFLNQEKATQNLTQILQAAHNGQIDTLFVARGTQVWGQFDTGNRQATTQPEQAKETVDLLDLAVTKALAAGANVYVVDYSEVPGGAEAAAILRYPLVQTTKEKATV
ncbi:MAG: hypothetical protein AAFP09_18440, partial [Cyanobacteria bacterium J06607_10]